MHNESNADQSDLDIPTTSKLKKLVRNTTIFGAYATGAGLVAASTYMGIRTQMIQLETAKLALEAAKNAAA